MTRSDKSKFQRCSKYIFSLLCFFQALLALGQVPQSINYQGLAKEAGDPIRDTEIGIRISILDEDFSALFTEEHVTTTTSNGIYAIKIGEGTVSLGTFTAIDWISGERYIQIELDADGSANAQSYELMGRSQVLSVPYALESGNADYANRSGKSDSSEVASSLISGYVVEESERSSYADSAGYATSISSDVIPSRSSRADTADYAMQSNEATNAAVAESLISGYVVEQSELATYADSAGYADSAAYASIAEEAVTAEVAASLAEDYVVEQSERSAYADSTDYATLAEEAITAQVAESLADDYVVDQAVNADTAAYLVGGVDTDSTNEIQSLSFEDDELTISDGNSVSIPVGSPRIRQNDKECTSDNAGLLRFEPTRKVIQYCDGDFWVDMNAAPLSINSSEIVAAICESSTGSVSINVMGGQHPVSVEWSNGVTGETQIENLSAGNYTVELTDGAGRTLSETFEVGTQEQTITVSASGQQPNTVCSPSSNDPAAPDANGQIVLTPSNGQSSGAFTFQLMTSGMIEISAAGATAGYEDVNYALTGSVSVVTGLPAGDYVISVTDNATGCETTESFTITSDFTAIPVINAQNITSNDNTSCDPTQPNGSADASGVNVVTGGSGSYIYSWFNSVDLSVAIDNDAVLEDVAAGVYILMVTDAQWGCSTSHSITIDSDTPTVTAGVSALTDNTVCDTSNNGPGDNDANGSITFNPQSNGVASGNFTFALETASGTPIPNGGVHLDGTVNYDDDAVGSFNTTVTGLDGDNYVMTITDLDNLCTVTHAFTIADDPTDVPVITINNITTTNNTSCDATAYNGSGDASSVTAVSGGTGDYRYEWATASSPGVIIDNDAMLTGVAGGDYLLTVIDDQTGCSTTSTAISIADTQPTIGAGESALVNNTVCDPANNDAGDNDANGSITFTPYSDGVSSGNYTFQLETASGTALPDGSTYRDGNISYDDDATGSTTTTVTGLDGDNYVMTITDLDNLCTTTFAFTIANDPTDFPVITLGNIAITNNITCDATAYNGSANASSATAVSGGTGDYRYEWATASSPGVIIDNDAILNGVASGDYLLTVIDDQTGCSTTSTTISIASTLPTIAAVESALTNNTVCDPANNDAGENDANGSITFTPYSDGVSSGNYTFQLETASGTALADGSTHLDGIINYDSDATGSVTTTVTGLDGDDYVMTITDLDNQCFTTYAFSIADDNTDLPVITPANIAITNNISCAGAGEADASSAVSGGTGDYRYQWATATSPGVLIDNDAVLENVIGGDYNLTVIDDQTGCVSATVTVSILDQSDVPTFAMDAVGSGSANNTVCDVNVSGDYNGVASVTTTETGTYTFTWYDGVGFTSPTANTTTHGAQSSVLSAAPAGIYTINIVNAVNGCDTTFQVTINDDFDTNMTSFDISSDVSFTNDMSASTDNGTITFDETDLNSTLGASAPSNYLVRLYTGASVSGTPSDVSTAPYTFTNLAAGDYTLVAVNPTTGCATMSSTVTITEVLAGVVADPTAVANNTVCDPTTNGAGQNDANGTITFTPTTDGVSSGNYTFSLATAGGTNIANGAFHLDGLVTYDDDANGSSSATVTGLDGDDYVMTITDLDDMQNVAYAFTITDDNTDIPMVSVGNIVITNNTTCDNTAYNGQADANGVGTVSGGSGNYEYEWATVAAPAVIIDNDANLTGVAGGDYLLTVTDIATGCSATPTQVTIGETGSSISVDNADATIVDQSNCSTGDGSITITQITITDQANVTSTSTTFSDFSFQWSAADGSALTVIPHDAQTGLFQIGESIIIDATGDNLLGTLVGVSSNYIVLSGLSGVVSDDEPIVASLSGTSANVNHTFDITTTSGTVGANAITGLMAGNYQVTITDINDCLNSSGVSSYTIDNSPQTISVLPSDANVLNNTSCQTPNGYIEILDVAIDGNNASTSPADYTFLWKKDGVAFVEGTDGTLGDANGGTDNQILGAHPGAYTVTITNTTTGCSGTEAFTILDDTVYPIMLLITDSDDTHCVLTDKQGDGALTFMITEGGGTAAVLSDYSVEWYRGTYTTAPGTTDANFLADDTHTDGTNSGNADVGSAKVNGNILSLDGLEAGNYTVFITKDNGDTEGNGNLGCMASATYTVTSDPTILSFDAATGLNVADNENCAPGNGFIQIQQVLNNGVPIALNNSSPYTISWISTGLGMVSTSHAGAIQNDQLTGVNGGIYSFEIIENITGCSTGTINVTVQDQQVDPEISISGTVDDNLCDGLNNSGDGSATIAITEEGTAIILNDFAIEWYRGTHVSAPGTADDDFIADWVGSSAGANAGTAAINGDILSLQGLEYGTYTVFVEKISNLSGSGNEGCTASKVITVGDGCN